MPGSGAIKRVVVRLSDRNNAKSSVRCWPYFHGYHAQRTAGRTKGGLAHEQRSIVVFGNVTHRITKILKATEDGLKSELSAMFFSSQGFFACLRISPAVCPGTEIE